MENMDVGNVQQLDHYALPAMNVERGEKFYSDILGARTIVKKDYEGSTFMKLGQNHFVLFSQDKASMPKRDSLESYPRCSFILPPGTYDRMTANIKTASSLVKEVTGTCGLPEGLVFMDSEGNILEVFKGTEEKLARLHHLHFETTNMDDSIEFYTKMLKLVVQDYSNATANLAVSTNQRLILHQVKELGEVTKTPYRGRHFSFYVNDDDFHVISSKLRKAGIKEQSAERDKHGPRGTDGQLAMYFLDPAGNRLEIVNQDSVYFARKYNFEMDAA